MSIRNGIVPRQWKSAFITPIEKNSKPEGPADFRPISLTPILSRTAERLIIRKYLHPVIQDSELFQDQFAFRPNGSTTSATIAISHTVVRHLDTEPFVRVVSFDFSKAFDTVRHYSVLRAFGKLSLPDEIFNWITDYYEGHNHCTSFQNEVSEHRTINAGVIQGSALGPISFITTASSLKPLNEGNSIFKYADDFYLIIPKRNIDTTQIEIQNIQAWASSNNLTLNQSKSREILFTRPRYKGNLPDNIVNIPRVKDVKILGVHLDHTLKAGEHVNQLISKCSCLMFLLKRLRYLGMSSENLHSIFNSIILSRVLYAAPSWWGFINESDKSRLIALQRRCQKFGYHSREAPSLVSQVARAHKKMFAVICNDTMHPLHCLLPGLNSHGHNLRTRSHNQMTPVLTDNNRRSFLNRMLHNLI